MIEKKDAFKCVLFLWGDDGAIINGGNIEGWSIHHQGRIAIRPYVGANCHSPPFIDYASHACHSPPLLIMHRMPGIRKG